MQWASSTTSRETPRLLRSRQKSRERSLSGATKRIRGGFEEDRIALFTVVFFDLPGLPAVLLILEVLRKLYPAGSYALTLRHAPLHARHLTLRDQMVLAPRRGHGLRQVHQAPHLLCPYRVHAPVQKEAHVEMR